MEIGFDRVFREQVTDEVVFQRTEEPLLNDVWNGADTCAVVCGAVREKKDAAAASLQRPLEYLFTRIDDATDTAASVLRFKVFLSVLYVHPDQVVDALAPAPRRLQLGSDGAVSPLPSAVQIDSAAEGVDRIADLQPPMRSRTAAPAPMHRVVCLRLERWVRSRKRGLLTPDRDRIALRDMGPPPSELLPESTDDWTVTSSVFRKVNVQLLEANLSSTSNPVADALGAHASAHSHKLHRDVAQTLTSFCRCLQEDGGPFRDAKLTHVLKPVFLQASRCSLTAYVETPSNSYCKSAGPLRFAERALRAVRARQAAPRLETSSIDVSHATDTDPDGAYLLDDGAGFRHESLLLNTSPRRGGGRKRNASFSSMTSSVETKLDRGSDYSRPGTGSSATRAFERSRTRVLDILQDLRQDLQTGDEDAHDGITKSLGQQHQRQQSLPSSPRRCFAEAGTGVGSLDDEDLAASREALRQQLSRFQVEKELLAKIRDGPRALVTDEAKEAVGDLVQRLEDERRQALEKARALMQQVWQLEAEKGDAQRKSRVLQERVDILEADRDAHEAILPQLRAQHEAQVEALKEQHTTTQEQMRRDADARLRKARADVAELAAKTEADRAKVVAQERKRAKEQLEALETRHKEEIKSLRDRAEDREAVFRQRLKETQSEGRKHIEQATLHEIERDRTLREAQDSLADAEAAHRQELDRVRSEIEEERSDMEQFRAEERDRAEQALRDLEMERKLRQEREEAHHAAAAAAQRRISALQDDISRLKASHNSSGAAGPASASTSTTSGSALVARVQQSEELTRLRRALREKDAELQRVLAQLQDERSHRSVLEDDATRYRTQLAARDEENQALKVVSEELSAAHEEACRDLEAAVQRVDLLEREAAGKTHLQADLARAGREVANLRENLEDAQSSLDTQDRRVSAAETRASGLASRLRETERRLEDALVERDRLVEEVEGLRVQVIRAEEEAAQHVRSNEELAVLRERLRAVEATARQDRPQHHYEDHRPLSRETWSRHQGEVRGAASEAASDVEDDPVRDALAQSLRDKEAEVKQLKRRIDALAHTNITFV
ncbi:Kinesin-like protein 5 [Hondaea fermentalgiana]|uniref:Kinesin-like protein 5 n=1 Tax=Hondaea fermentalgiana TaxID=2315210 RepID=A0A2R5GIU4_9STRA|nr:Kinesin-like protein 5 [Hondaea fermentalgiana]|eukprot:GBG27794.1 Kinesin-like protein 5 [Hondaea fermentalgiana]